MLDTQRLQATESPLLSVIIINWNAKKYICGCLESVLASDYPNLELILVDNASTDGSIEELKASLKERIKKVKLMINDKNYGAAYALNQGVSNSCGKYITFLASDTQVESSCFSLLIQKLESDDGIGALESKLLLMEQRDRFDHAGEYLSQFGLLIQRHAGQEIDRGQLDYPAEIFSAKGTALTVRRQAFEKAGGFDSDYFMFLEETDLCWRIWLAGYRILFFPAARIYHASGVSIRAHQQRKYLARYYGSRNYIATLVKNLGFQNLLKIVPLHTAMWFTLALYFILRLKIKDGFYILKGIFANFIDLFSLYRKRSRIQRNRVTSDRVLMPKIMRRIGFSYLMQRVGMW